MRRATSAASASRLPGMMLPSDSFITRVGSSAPRLRSISSRDQRAQHRRRAIGRRQCPRHRRGPDVIGDMGGEQRRLQAQRAIRRRQGVGGMVAQEQTAALAVRPAMASKAVSVIAAAVPACRPQRVDGKAVSRQTGHDASHDPVLRCRLPGSAALAQPPGARPPSMSATRPACRRAWRSAASTAPTGPARAGGRSQPKACAALLTGPLQARYYYLYASDGAAGTWEGKTHFCVAPDATFKSAGRGNCARRGFDRRGFFEVDTGKQPDWTQTLSN